MSTSRNAKQRAKLIAFIVERDGPNCIVCDKPFSESDPPTLDHIIPKSMGGTRTRDNLQLAHALCNNRRGNTDGQAWSDAHKGRNIKDAPPR